MSYLKNMIESYPKHQTAQEICEESHGEEPCFEDECPHCCDHEWDPGEGMMCLGCGSEYKH